MAWSYKLPNFNLWCRVYRVEYLADDDNFFYEGPWYSPCALKLHQFAGTHIIQVPKYSGFRPLSMTPRQKGDILQVSGFPGSAWLRIYQVGDVGAGYDNEHRHLSCEWDGDVSWDGVKGLSTGAGGFLLPPEGWEPVPLLPPQDFWETPSEVLDHPHP